MIWSLAAFGLVVGLAGYSPAQSQSVVGRAIVDGRPATLFDNKTWAFAADEAPTCAVLTSKLSFCGDRNRWKPTAVPTPDVTASYSVDGMFYGQFIIEDLGQGQGLTLDAVRDFVLDFAGQVSGDTPVLLTKEPVSIDGFAGETLIYTFSISGLKTVYSNTLLLGQSTLVQAITYEYAADYSAKHKDLHAEFLAATQVTE